MTPQHMRMIEAYEGLCKLDRFRTVNANFDLSSTWPGSVHFIYYLKAQPNDQRSIMFETVGEFCKWAEKCMRRDPILFRRFEWSA